MAEITNQLLFFFSGLGVFNGLLMSVYFLFFIKPQRLQNQLFGLLLLMLSIRIGKSIFLYFLEDLSKVILQIGLSACVFIGPFLFFYIQSVLHPRVDWIKKIRPHLFVLFALTLIVGLCYSYPRRPDLWNPLIVQGIYFIWLSYVVAAAFALKRTFTRLFSKGRSLTLIEKWLLVVFFTNALVCLVFHTILYFGFPSYISGPIVFSFVFYALAGFLLFHSKRKLVFHGAQERYNNKKIQAAQASELEFNLKQLMEEQFFYKQADLKLDQLAWALKVSPHMLSQYLNDNLGKTFAQYINEYRIQAACDLLKTDHQFTLEGVGYEVGFRSKSNFYASFKKLRACTPSQYLKQAQKE
ncbi:MAG: helix-turn-helix transcriptional regulator [Bacteroidota bacterium]